MVNRLVLEAHPCHRTKDNDSDEYDGQDAGQRHDAGSVGRGRYGLNHIIDGANQVDTHHDADHDTDKSRYVNGNKPPVKMS